MTDEVLPSELLAEVRDRIARGGGQVTLPQVEEALLRGGRPFGDTGVLAVHEALRRDVLGSGPLEELLALAGVTDVLVNGAGPVWIDRGEGLEQTSVRVGDDEAVRRLAQRLAAAGGRRLDDASPYVDTRLPDGVRFHAVLAPVSRPGTTISLRVPRRRAFDLTSLREHGMFGAGGADLLRRVVEARASFLVSGGTGTGKTALLGALLGEVADQERIVLVEDSSELRLSIYQSRG